MKQRHFLYKEKAEKMHCQQIYTTKNVKGNFLGWDKMILDESTELQEVKKKSTRKDKYVGKQLTNKIIIGMSCRVYNI